MPTKSRGLAQLQPVDSSNLHDKVYAQLRQGIMGGKFRPGESLTLRGLAAALGTSIMPARDAVLRLSGERALEQHGRGVRVPVLDEQRFDDIVRFRLALEGEACALAVERATPADLAAIERARERAAKAAVSGVPDRILSTNQEFHFAVYRAAHNALLQSLIEMLWLQSGPYIARLVEESGNQQSLDMSAHDRIVAAIRRRDAEAARAALHSDLTERTVPFGPPLAKVDTASDAKAGARVRQSSPRVTATRAAGVRPRATRRAS